MKGKALFGLIAIIVLISCDKDEPVECLEEGTSVNLFFSARFGNDPMIIDSIYRNFENFPIKIEKVNFFFTDVQFSNTLDTLKLEKPFLYRKNQSEQILSYTIPAGDFGDFSKINFNVGVAQPENGSDPTAYSTDNHYGVSHSEDMHWSWNTGYIFMKIEGRYDTIPGSTETPLNFAWHIGNDVNLKSIEKNHSIAINSNQLNNLGFVFDLKKVFLSGTDSVFIKENPIIHSTPAQIQVSDRIINNFANSIEIQ